MPNPVVHFEINGKNAPKLFEFYSMLFGWKIDASNPMGYGFVDTASSSGINGGMGQPDEGAGVTIYVAVKDPQNCLDKVVSMGGKVTMPVTEIPGMVTLARFADPEGNIIGLFKED